MCKRRCLRSLFMLTSTVCVSAAHYCLCLLYMNTQGSFISDEVCIELELNQLERLGGDAKAARLLNLRNSPLFDR